MDYQLILTILAEGEDFTGLSSTYSPFLTQFCYTILSIDDHKVESPESFTVNLRFMSGQQSQTILNPSSVTVVIIDDDGKLHSTAGHWWFNGWVY